MNEEEEQLRNNKYYVLGRVSVTGSLLFEAPEQFRSDKEIVMKALKSSGSIFSRLPKEMRDDSEVVIMAVKSSPSSLKMASSRLKNEKNFILKCVSQYPGVCQYIPENFQKDKEVALAAITYRIRVNDWNAWYCFGHFRDDKNMMLKYLNILPHHFSKVSDRLKSDYDICLAAVNKRVTYAYMFPADLLENEDFIMAALDKDNGLWGKLWGPGKQDFLRQYPSPDKFQVAYHSRFIK